MNVVGANKSSLSEIANLMNRYAINASSTVSGTDSIGWTLTEVSTVNAIIEMTPTHSGVRGSERRDAERSSWMVFTACVYALHTQQL